MLHKLSPQGQVLSVNVFQVIKNRKIRVDIASGTDGEEQASGGMGRGRGRPPRDESREDRTPSDWRSATREGPPPGREGFRERDRDRDRGDRGIAFHCQNCRYLVDGVSLGRLGAHCNYPMNNVLVM